MLGQTVLQDKKNVTETDKSSDSQTMCRGRARPFIGSQFFYNGCRTLFLAAK
jgi:hypothetical protein